MINHGDNTDERMRPSIVELALHRAAMRDAVNHGWPSMAFEWTLARDTARAYGHPDCMAWLDAEGEA